MIYIISESEIAELRGSLFMLSSKFRYYHYTKMYFEMDFRNIMVHPFPKMFMSRKRSLNPRHQPALKLS